MISIAMTTYNGEKYLAEQIDSILAQSYSDFELIISDDCSTDATRTILKDYKAKDTRIKLHFNEANLGFKKNFEQALYLCSGEFIAFADQDDVWLDNHLEILINNIGGGTDKYLRHQLTTVDGPCLLISNYRFLIEFYVLTYNNKKYIYISSFERIIK